LTDKRELVIFIDMKNFKRDLSRRDFLELATVGGLGAILPGRLVFNHHEQTWPVNQKLGRLTIWKLDVRARPAETGKSVKVIYEDTIVPILREVVGETPTGLLNRRWLETPDGYIYSPRIQQVFNRPNAPVSALPTLPDGKKGMWAEVTVPYVDFILANPPARSPLLKETQKPRLYYSQVYWIDEMRVNTDGKVMYRVNERYGTYGDIYWAPAEAFRPIVEDDVSPINPDAEEKKVVVNLTRQTLTCFEGKREVYFCQVATGAKWDADGNKVETWSTPPGPHPISRKYLSLRMSGPTTGDWPAVAWTSIFATGGVAIHSTYWHNDYGLPRSHGCVNAKPEDARWIYRWSFPYASIEPGMIDVSNKWPPVGTIVDVIES
jgi:lipoprotein-anchoring transpeptidase ErfK/SrfK